MSIAAHAADVAVAVAVAHKYQHGEHVREAAHEREYLHMLLPGP